MLIKYLQVFILQLSDSVTESHLGAFITFPRWSLLDGEYRPGGGQEFKASLVSAWRATCCLVSFRLRSHFLSPWGLPTGRIIPSTLDDIQSGEGLSGDPATLGFLIRLPFDILLLKVPLFLLNSWNFLIPCGLSTRVNLSKCNTPISWKVPNIEYINTSVFWTKKN